MRERIGGFEKFSDAQFPVFPVVPAQRHADRPDAVNRNIGHITAEWQVPSRSLPGLALFLDAAKGNKDFDMAIVGVRYYFGGNKSLIQRHRQDDPDNLLGDSLTSGQMQYQQRKDAAAAAAAAAANQCPPGSLLCV